jgi:hypothetical protein
LLAVSLTIWKGMALQPAEKFGALKGHNFSPAAIAAKKIGGFTGCGKTPGEKQEVSGHDFSRAANG